MQHGFYDVITAHGTTLHRLPSGELCHFDPLTNCKQPKRVLAYVSSKAANNVFLVCDNMEPLPLSIGADAWTSTMLPIRLLPLGEDVFSLYEAFTGLLLLAFPVVEGDPSPRCVFCDYRVPGGWETFKLKPAVSLCAELRLRSLQIEGVCLRAQRGLQALLTSSDCSTYFEEAGRIMPQREFEETAQRLVQDSVFLRASHQALGEGPAAVGLRNLAATAALPAKRGGFLGSLFRSEPPLYKLDCVNDERFAGLGPASLNDRHKSVVEKLNATARRQRAPKRDVCVLATARNEGPYILEWVAYHLAIGVDHIFLYSNNNGDGSAELLATLHREGVITYVENTGAKKDHQLKAYAHALSVLPSILDYEWTILLDLDEYLVTRSEPTWSIRDILASFQQRPTDVIPLSWNVYWSSGHVYWSEAPTIKRFRKQNEVSCLVKSVFRTGKFTRAHPHHPLSFDNAFPIIARNGLGHDITYPRGQMTMPELLEPNYVQLWVNHYFSRSAEEFLWKWARNDLIRGITSLADVPDPFLQNFMRCHHLQAMVAPPIVDQVVEAAHREAVKLMRLPAVARAMAHIMQYTRDAALKTDWIVRNVERSGLSQVKLDFLALFDTKAVSLEGETQLTGKLAL